jgi:hypothetical protein
MANDRIMQEWESFAAIAVPANAATNQAQEMRRAFFAGAYSMWSMVRDIGGDDVTELAGVELLESVNSEVMDFVRRMKRGEF